MNYGIIQQSENHDVYKGGYPHAQEIRTRHHRGHGSLDCHARPRVRLSCEHEIRQIPLRRLPHHQAPRRAILRPLRFARRSDRRRL